MNAVGQRLISPVLVPAAETTVLTGVQGTVVKITFAVVGNNDAASEHTLTAWLVPSGGATGAATLLDKVTILRDQTIRPNLFVGAYLAAGDTLRVSADTADVINLHLHGVIVTL